MVNRYYINIPDTLQIGKSSVQLREKLNINLLYSGPPSAIVGMMEK